MILEKRSLQSNQIWCHQNFLIPFCIIGMVSTKICIHNSTWENMQKSTLNLQE